MVRHLWREGVCVGRHRVRRLMRLKGLQAIYQAPRMTRPYPEYIPILPPSCPTNQDHLKGNRQPVLVGSGRGVKSAYVCGCETTSANFAGQELGEPMM